MNCLTVIAASVVLLWGENPNWLGFRNLVLFIWYIILFIRSFSSTLPSRLSRLIGRYFDGSQLSFLPGLVIGTILAIFHCFWKCPFFKHSLYIAVIVWGMLWNMRARISLVIPCEYICMYVCVCVCMYVCVCVCIYVYICVYVYIFMYYLRVHVYSALTPNIHPTVFSAPSTPNPITTPASPLCPIICYIWLFLSITIPQSPVPL